MKTLCLGGSFNPIHHGHLICARHVAETAGYQRVMLIPNRQPPHKAGQTDIASPSDRLRMCELAIGGDSSGLFQVSDIELARDGPSYTIDTAAALKKSGWAEVHWLIGADMLINLPAWHRAAELIRDVHFVVMHRPTVPIDWQSLPAEFRELHARLIEAPLIQISSTDIRRRVAANQSISYLTPPRVADYIRDQNLYR